jgi:hypothetical protein
MCGLFGSIGNYNEDKLKLLCLLNETRGTHSTGIFYKYFDNEQGYLYKDIEKADHIIQNWIRNRNTIEFLGIWEQLNNPNFKPIEFEGFKKEA